MEAVIFVSFLSAAHVTLSTPPFVSFAQMDMSSIPITLPTAFPHSTAPTLQPQECALHVYLFTLSTPTTEPVFPAKQVKPA